MANLNNIYLNGIPHSRYPSQEPVVTPHAGSALARISISALLNPSPEVVKTNLLAASSGLKILFDRLPADELTKWLSADSRGFTPLHIAAEANNIESCRVLLTRTTLQQRAALLAGNFEGLTPLHIAVIRCHLLVVQLLLNHLPLDLQAKLFLAKESRKLTALDLAQETDNPIHQMIAQKLWNRMAQIPLDIRFHHLFSLPPSLISVTIEEGSRIYNLDDCLRMAVIWNGEEQPLRNALKTVHELIMQPISAGYTQNDAEDHRIVIEEFLQTIPAQILALAAHELFNEVASLVPLCSDLQQRAVIPQLNTLLVADILNSTERPHWPQLLSYCYIEQKEKLLMENLIEWPKDFTHLKEAWRQECLSWEQSHDADRGPSSDLAMKYLAALTNATARDVEHKIQRAFSNKSESSEELDQLLQRRLAQSTRLRRQLIVAINRWRKSHPHEEVTAPDSFYDSLTTEMMKDPVMLPTVQRTPEEAPPPYIIDRTTLVRLKQKRDAHGNTVAYSHPLTSKWITPQEILPAIALKAQIESWKQD